MNRVVSLALATVATGYLPQLRADTGPGVRWRICGFDPARISLNSVASGPGGAFIAGGDTLGLGVGIDAGFFTIDPPEKPATRPRRFNRLRLEPIPP